MVAADGGATTYAAKYWPYGGTRWSTGASPTEPLFTGQREEKDDAAGLGLYNYGARFYSTVMGRFVSVDPVVGSAGDPQSWNGYSYTLNNPLRYVDPLGLTPDEDWVNSGSIGIERDTGCSWDCQGLQALAEVGWSYEQWQAWEHQQLVGALQYVAYQNAKAAEWAASQSIANDTAPPSAGGGGGGGCGPFGFVCDAGSGILEEIKGAVVDYAEFQRGRISAEISRYRDDPAAAVADGLVLVLSARRGKPIEPGKPPAIRGNPTRFKSRPALREHNRMARDAAKEAGLNRDQQKLFHKEIGKAYRQGEQLKYDDLVKIARSYR